MPLVVTTGAPTRVCSPWADADDLRGPCAAPDAWPAGLLDECLEAASDVLFELSGRQFPGECYDVVRPCSRYGGKDHGRPPLGVPAWGNAWGGGSSSGAWATWGVCSCNRTYRSGCSSVPEIQLGAAPITAVEQVLIDGVVLDPAQYRVDDQAWLVRLPDPDGQHMGWPCCQDMTLDSSQPNTFEVTFWYGSEPPPAGVIACAALACQLAMAANPDSAGKCRLPGRVTTVARQGVSVTALDPSLFIDKGYTGLPEVDYFLRAVNPQHISRRATVTSPDLGRRVRRPNT